MDNPDRLGGAETNTVTRELVVNMVRRLYCTVLYCTVLYLHYR